MSKRCVNETLQPGKQLLTGGILTLISVISVFPEHILIASCLMCVSVDDGCWQWDSSEFYGIVNEKSDTTTLVDFPILSDHGKA